MSSALGKCLTVHIGAYKNLSFYRTELKISQEAQKVLSRALKYFQR